MPRRLGLAMLVAILWAGAAAAQTDAERKAYLQCAGCHGLDGRPGAAGPPLTGVYGRKAGGVPTYRFSSAWKASNVVCNDRTLDALPADPRGFIPGSRKFSPPVRDPAERRLIIGYLKRLSGPAPVKPAAASGR